MSESKGSRDVSLGPYRSTELALEDRLSDIETHDILSYISDNRLYFKQEKGFGNEDIVNLLLKLGYRQEADFLYVKYGVSTKDSGIVDRFVYLQEESPESGAILISGDYKGNSRQILDDIEIIKSVKSEVNSSYGNSVKKSNSSIKYIAGSGLVTLASSLLFIHEIIPAIFIAGGEFGLVSWVVSSIFDRNHEKVKQKCETALSYLSHNSKSYSFGESVYYKLASETISNTLSGNEPKQLETSELKQLPEETKPKKEWAKNQIGPETFVVSEETVKYFEKPESERSLKSAPAFEGPSELDPEVLKK